jgi:hypothetical protein
MKKTTDFDDNSIVIATIKDYEDGKSRLQELSLLGKELTSHEFKEKRELKKALILYEDEIFDKEEEIYEY